MVAYSTNGTDTENLYRYDIEQGRIESFSLIVVYNYINRKTEETGGFSFSN